MFSGGNLAFWKSADWTPLQFPSLTGWWAASDLSGQSDGTDVTSWLDKSGNGRTFDQTSVSNYPDKETVSGFTAVDFLQSNNETLDTAANIGTLIGNTGLLAVVTELTGNPSATAANTEWLNNGIFTDESNGYYILSARTASGVPQWVFYMSETSADATIEITATTGQKTLLLMYRTAGGLLTASINGGTESTTAIGVLGSTVGQGLLGQNYNLATPVSFNGKIYEIVTSTANGSSGDRASLISYLKTKFGIT